MGTKSGVSYTQAVNGGTGARRIRCGLGAVWRYFAVCCCLFVVSNIALAQCHFSSAKGRPAITYRFQPEVTPPSLVMHVTFSFRMDKNGMQVLALPTDWAGEKLHAMTNLRVLSKGASLEKGAGAGSEIVHGSPRRTVVIAYDLQKDWKGPLVNPLQFHPVLMPEYFQFTGDNALVRLKLDDQAIETANFDWQKIPAAWTLATSFGTTTSTMGRCQTYTGPWRKVNEGLYAAGDYRVHHFEINHRPAILAVRGAWFFSDDEAISDIQRVVGMVRDFWHDNDFPYFLVTLTPFERDSGSSDGSAFTNAFWMYVSRRDSLTGLLPQLAHESFHAWDPLRMGIVPAGYKGKSTGWFNEGATEYYAQLLTYRAGELSAAEYVRSLNTSLRRFPASNDEYVRGRVISLWLDATIRRESGGRHSLNDVMFDMVRSGDQPYTLARILSTAGRYLSPESRVLLQQAVAGHGDLTMPEHLPVLGACAQASLGDLPTFDLGFDFDHSRAAKAVTGVVENGPAFDAGLRDGQSLVGYSVYNNDPDRMTKFKIHTDAGDRQISFYPRGKAIRIWQYKLDKAVGCLQ